MGYPLDLGVWGLARGLVWPPPVMLGQFGPAVTLAWGCGGCLLCDLQFVDHIVDNTCSGLLPLSVMPGQFGPATTDYGLFGLFHARA